MTPTYAYPLFDSNKHIESGFINVYQRGNTYEPGYCRVHRESVYHNERPAFRIRVKVKEEKKT